MTASASSPSLIDHPEPPLSAPLTLQFDYTRSVGPVLGEFFTQLRSRHVVGVRGSDGRVHVPPLRIDLAGSPRVHTMQTLQGPELCAGKTC